MKKLDLGQSIGILANVGVIAGIIFLAVELRQNNSLMAAQARAFEVEMARALPGDILQNTDIAVAVTKFRNNEELTDVEQTQLRFLTVRLLRNWQWEWGEFTAGALSESEFNAENKIRAYRSNAWGVRETFEENPEIYQSGFVQWMEENVVNER